MVKFKLNISVPKEGRAVTVELDDPVSNTLIGKKIGDIIDGEALGLEYGKLRITGGTDKSGFPMRPDVSGGRKAYILTGKGVGLRRARGKEESGYRRRILVRGSVITRDIYQVNLVVVE
jgi:small subunit ribosomal protein S6e